MALIASPGVLPDPAARAQSLQALSQASEAKIKIPISSAKAVMTISRKTAAHNSIRLTPFSALLFPLKYLSRYSGMNFIF